MFDCDKCGECCRNLDKSSIYNSLHNGDSVCKYLKGNLCNIYENRPLLCRIDECYDKFFKSVYTYEEYIHLNRLWCAELKKRKEK